MYTLLLDSSDKDLIVGLAKDGVLIHKVNYLAWQRQSEYMIPEIQKILANEEISLMDIDNVALGIGPGSYTGVRIPLAIAKTLNVISNVDIIPLSSLCIMGNTQERYIALINARSNRSYIGIYDMGKQVIDDQVIVNDEIYDFIAPYVEQGFTIKGDLSYLNLGIEVKPDILEGLLSYSLITLPSENPKAIKPVYLKD